MISEGIRYEEEKKRKELQDKEQKDNLERVSRKQLQKEKLQKVEETDRELSHLKEALENHQIDESMLKKVSDIIEDDIIDSQEIKEILEMIGDFEQDEEQKKYLPKELQITKKEYLQALSDIAQRQLTLQKLDDALGILIQHISPASMRGINIVGGLTLLLDKKLVIVQETHIEIKRSLESLDIQITKGFFATIKKIFFS